jgi:hypothetical protein
MEKSPSEANSNPASQEIPRLLWNSEVHYRVSSKQQQMRTDKTHSVANRAFFTGGKHDTSLSLYTISL